MRLMLGQFALRVLSWVAHQMTDGRFRILVIVDAPASG